MARNNCYDYPVNSECMERILNHDENYGNVQIVDYPMLRTYIKKRLAENFLPINKLCLAIEVSDVNIRGFLTRGKDKAVSVRTLNRILYIIDGGIDGFEKYRNEARNESR